MGVPESPHAAVVDCHGGLIDADKEEYLGSQREGRIFLTDGVEDDHGGTGMETTERKSGIVRPFLVISHVVPSLHQIRSSHPLPAIVLGSGPGAQ